MKIILCFYAELVLRPNSRIDPPQTRKAELSDAIFESYKPTTTLKNAKPHPGKLAESAAMAAVRPPKTTYIPNLPESVIKEGRISDAQLEPVIYTGAAHSQLLPSGERKGFFIGDGTGVGKGREIASILWDNWNQGRKKHVWISLSPGLLKDAQRDIEGVGWDKSLVISHAKIKTNGKIPNNEGVLFTTYHTMGSEGRKTGSGTRLDQIAEWLGEDFDGVIAFDEAHKMGNAVSTKGPRGKTKPAKAALAGVELQKRFPNARVVYVSATGATQVSNLSYAGRLGLWGPGTPFGTVESFINKVSAGGDRCHGAGGQRSKGFRILYCADALL